MRRTVAGLIAVAALILIGAVILWAAQSERDAALGTTQYAAAGSNKAVPPPAASPADDGNWTMPGKDYASTRFSALNQINPGNVGKLQVYSTFSTGTTEGF